MRYRAKICTAIMVISILAIGAVSWRQQILQPSPSRNVPSSAGVGGRDIDVTNGLHPDRVQSGGWAQRRAVRRELHDLDAVVATYKEANDCLAYHSARQEVSSILGEKQWDDLSRETLETLENMDASSARNMHVLRELEGLCRGSDQKQLAEVFSSAVFEAALQGSPDAEACFVLSGVSPLEVSESVASVHTEVNRYLQYAPIFTRNALERGDPRVAARELSRFVASASVHPSWLDNLPGADPRLTWRGARLASLRALPEQRERMEHDLVELGKRGVLSPSEVTQADAWARDVFERQFAGQASINVDSPIQCHSSPDVAP